MNGPGSTLNSAQAGEDAWALPQVITRRNKYPAGALIFLIAGILYIASNHFHLFAPQMLPMSRIDRTMPFVPWTVWIYVSEYLFFAAAYVTINNTVNLNRFLYAFLSLQTVSVLIFMIWPTTYPRELFPLTEDIDALTYYVFSTLRNSDTPASCCPSLHVSSCYLVSMLFLNEQKSKFVFFFLWASAVAFTTLTTKQHYLIDVITGLMMAALFHWIFNRMVTYRQANR